jgi:hypothetical protein
MAVFPELNIDWGMTENVMDGVLLRETESGKIYARDQWGKVKHQWTINLSLLTPTQERTLREFYIARQGRAEQFYFFHPYSSMQYTDVSVDETPNGILDTFTIPGHTTSSVTVYVDDMEENPSHYTIEVGTGTNGEDQIVFGASYIPANGTEVTVDFTGRRRFLVRFGSEYTTALNMYHQASLTIVEDF